MQEQLKALEKRIAELEAWKAAEGARQVLRERTEVKYLSPGKKLGADFARTVVLVMNGEAVELPIYE